MQGVQGSVYYFGPDQLRSVGNNAGERAVENRSEWVYYCVPSRFCRRCALTFPDNGGSWVCALRGLSWYAQKWEKLDCSRRGAAPSRDKTLKP